MLVWFMCILYWVITLNFLKQLFKLNFNFVLSFGLYITSSNSFLYGQSYSFATLLSCYDKIVSNAELKQSFNLNNKTKYEGGNGSRELVVVGILF